MARYHKKATKHSYSVPTRGDSGSGRNPHPTFREAFKRTSLQAFKLSSMRQFVALDMSSHMGYCRIHNKQRRKNEKDKSRLSSWRREARGSKENGNQISTGTHPGDAAATPRVLDLGPKIHRDRISRSSKSSQQRSSSRVCLELITPAREQRANHPHRKGSVQACKRTSTSVQASKRG